MNIQTEIMPKDLMKKLNNIKEGTKWTPRVLKALESLELAYAEMEKYELADVVKKFREKL